MKKGNFHAFGCSFTAGDGIEEIEKRTKYPHPNAWPGVAARALGFETCNNIAMGGGSNKSIVYRVSNTEFTKNDIVVIMWTFPDRTCIVDNTQNNDLRTFLVSNSTILNTDLSQSMYYEFIHTDENANFETMLYINYVNYYLAKKVKKVFNFTFQFTNLEERLGKKYCPEFAFELCMKNDKTMPRSPYDNFHPSEEGHADFGNKVAEYIRTQIKI